MISARVGKALSDRWPGRAPEDGEPAAGRTPRPSSGEDRRRVVDAAGEEDGDGRGPDSRNGPLAVRGRPDEPPPGEHLGERQPVGRRQHAGDRTCAEELIAERNSPPRRGIRFWWCDEIYSEYRYFADHPGEEKKVLADLNQDMVGAKQSEAPERNTWRGRPGGGRPTSRMSRRACSTWWAGTTRISPPGPRVHSAGNRLLEAPVLAGNARAVPREGGPLLRLDRPHGVQRLVGRRSRNDPHRLARRVHPLLRRRPLAGRPDAAEAQRLRRRRAALVAGQRRRRRGEACHSWPRGGRSSWDAISRRRRHGSRAEKEPSSSARTPRRTCSRSTSRKKRRPPTRRKPSARRSAACASRRGPALLDGVAQTLRQRIPATAVLDHGRDPARERLAARVPLWAVATLSEWMALEHAAAVKRQAKARSDRDAKEKDEEAAGPAAPGRDRPRAHQTTRAGGSRRSWRRRS